MEPSISHSARPRLSRRADRRPALAAAPIFHSLAAPSAAEEPAILLFARGDTIFERGAAATGVYFVIEGAVQLLAEGVDGRDRVIELFGPGEMFGEIGVFMQVPYQAEAQAVGPTTLIHVDKARVLAAVARDGELAARMLREVTRRVQKLIGSILGTSSNHADDRVANYLLQLAGRDDGISRKVTLPAPKGTVASLLGLTPETLSRIMRRFCEDGLISMEGRHVLIPDVHRLQSLRCCTG